MTTRAIKVKGEKLSFLAYADSAEQLLTGVTTGSTPTGWNFKVKGTYLHWVDNDGAERRKLGILTSNTGTPGTIDVKGELLVYVDDDGDERSAGVAIGYPIAASGIRPRFRRASDGRLWVIYSVSYTMYARYSDDDGITWSAAETIHTLGVVTGDGPQFDFVLDSSDVPHLVWAERVGTAAQKTLFYTWRNSITEDWTIAHEDITGTTAYYQFPKIAIDSVDYIHIIYHAGTLGSAYARYIKGIGGAWGAEYRVDAHTYHDLDSQDIAIDSSDNVYCAYTSRRSRSVYLRVYTDSWQAEETLYTQDDYAVTQCLPRIAIDSNDDLHYVWTGRGHGTNTVYHNIQYMKRTSGSWGSQVGLTDIALNQGCLSRTSNQSYGLDIAVTTSDVLHVVWQWYIKHISYDGSWSAIDEPTPDSGIVCNQLLSHRHPNNQGILASGYYLVFAQSGQGLRFYEGA